MATRLQYLFERHLNKTSTAEERLELMGMALESGKQEAVRELIALAADKAGEETDVSEEKAEDIMRQLFPGGQVVDGRKNFSWRKIAVAASILLVIGLGSYFMFFNKGKKIDDGQGTIASTKDVPAPSTSKATITLANGKVIYLDSIANGTISTENNVTVIKTAEGKIIYSASPSPSGGGEPVYNTLSNPRGSKVIDMTLADGSHVWLNAGSSVTYPVAFVGDERKVSITGEAYFEVTHDANKPFYVSKGDVSVQVLGTHFNVNAYDDEADIKVTLLEGSVKASPGPAKGGVILKPGEQAQINSEIKVAKNVDLEQVMAWKNGKFDFGESTDLKDIMRQVARWYDVDIEYRGELNQQFWGSVSRQENVSKVLEKFELTGRVHFKLEGRKIIVMP